MSSATATHSVDCVLFGSPLTRGSDGQLKSGEDQPRYAGDRGSDWTRRGTHPEFAWIAILTVRQ